MNEPKPLRVLQLGPIKARWITEDEPPTIAETRIEEVQPVYVRGNYAVYPMQFGLQYQVHGHGAAERHPFRTTDLELARTVCDHWAATDARP